MGYKYKSDVPKKPHTEQELRVIKALASWSLPSINQVVCFDCGKQYVMRDTTKFPSECRMCKICYESIGQYCLPDAIIETGEPKIKKSVVFVNGPIHDRARNKARDQYQSFRLKQLGYKIFVLSNDEIDYLKETTLRAILRTFVEATKSEELYQQLIRYEREIPIL